jgi:exodeoxyribonuclease VII small subunit
MEVSEKKGETFEAMMARLEVIVEELERGELPLEEAIARFEEGMKLGRECRRILEEAEGRVTKLVEADGEEKHEDMGDAFQD